MIFWGIFCLSMSIYSYTHDEISLPRFLVALFFTAWTFKLDPKTLDNFAEARKR